MGSLSVRSKQKNLGNSFSSLFPVANIFNGPRLFFCRTRIVGKGGLWVRRIVGKADCG